MMIALFAALIVCIILSAFFSGAEMSYSSCSRIRIENLKESGDKRAARAFGILENFDDALGSILTGNNLVNIAASSIGSVIVIKLIGSGYTWIATVVVTILLVIFGETIPKIRAKKISNTLALRYSAPVKGLMTVLKPFVFIVIKIVDFITRELKGEDADMDEDTAAEEAIDELQTIIETAEDEDVLDELEAALVSSDVGVKTTVDIIHRLEERVKKDKFLSKNRKNIFYVDDTVIITKEGKVYYTNDYFGA